MNVAEICHRSVVTAFAVDELVKAAQLMREQHIGYLVVVEPEISGELRPVGVLTDRDIVVAVVAKEADVRTLTVGDVMTEQPVTVHEDAPITTALSEMRRIGVRRLPIVGARGQLVGILSVDDVLDAIATELQNVAGSIRNEQRIETALRP